MRDVFVKPFTSKNYEPDLEDPKPLLKYNLSEAPQGQPLMKGRMLAEPSIVLSDYRAKGLIDWLEVRVVSKQEDSAQNIALRLKSIAQEKIFVSGEDRGERYWGKAFLLRIQEPTLQKATAVFETLQSLPSFSGIDLINNHEISGIEVSVDVYPRAKEGGTQNDTCRDRRLMSELLRKHVHLFHDLRDGGQNTPRYVDGWNKRKPTSLIKRLRGPLPKAAANVPRLVWEARNAAGHRPAPLNSTVYFGNKDGAFFVRLQDKITDQRIADDFKLLPVEERRSRVEIAFTNDFLNPFLLHGLGLTRIQDIGKFPFRKFCERAFCFELPTFSKLPLFLVERLIFKSTGVFGLDCYQRGADLRLSKDGFFRPSTLRAGNKKGFTRRYIKLNKMIARALDEVGPGFVGQSATNG